MEAEKTGELKFYSIKLGCKQISVLLNLVRREQATEIEDLRSEIAGLKVLVREKDKLFNEQYNEAGRYAKQIAEVIKFFDYMLEAGHVSHEIHSRFENEVLKTGEVKKEHE